MQITAEKEHSALNNINYAIINPQILLLTVKASFNVLHKIINFKMSESSTEAPAESVESLTKEVETLKQKLEEERQKLNDVTCT